MTAAPWNLLCAVWFAIHEAELRRFVFPSGSLRTSRPVIRRASTGCAGAPVIRLPRVFGGGLYRDCRGRAELLFQWLASPAVCRSAESAFLPLHDRAPRRWEDASRQTLSRNLPVWQIRKGGPMRSGVVDDWGQLIVPCGSIPVNRHGCDELRRRGE